MPRDHHTAPRFAQLGRALTVLRLVRGVTQAELAERCGIRANQISRYESGDVLPQLAQLDRLLTALDLRPIQLYLVIEHVEHVDRLVEGTSTGGELRRAAVAYWDRVATTESLLLRHLRRATLELFEEEGGEPKHL